MLLQGPPGVGKPHSAIALDATTVARGFSVAFYRLDERLHAMKRDAEAPPRRLKGTKYLKNALPIVDEVGFRPLTRREASRLFRLVNYRHQCGAMIITTNKSVRDCRRCWPLAGR